MKKINKITYLTMILIVGLASCNDPITEFGFDGQLFGKIVDGNGNIVSGDIKSATFAVHAFGERDLASMVMRINDDGTYANTKLYPQSYKVWLIGPFIGGKTDTVLIDLTGGKMVEKDFQVIPLLSISKPAISGSPTSTSVSVNFSVSGNEGNSPNLREIYVSTVSWPTRTTGTGSSGGGYFTKIVTVSENQGTALVDGLKPNTKYFIRIGARATGQSLFNLSDQISFTTSN